MTTTSDREISGKPKEAYESKFLEVASKFYNENKTFNDHELIQAAAEAYWAQEQNERDTFYQNTVLTLIRQEAARGPKHPMRESDSFLERIVQFETAFQAEIKILKKEDLLKDFLNPTVKQKNAYFVPNVVIREGTKVRTGIAGVVAKIRDFIYDHPPEKKVEPLIICDYEGRENFFSSQLNNFLAACEGKVSDRVFKKLQAIVQTLSKSEQPEMEAEIAKAQLGAVFAHADFLQDPRMLPILKLAANSGKMDWHGIFLQPDPSHPHKNKLRSAIDEKMIPILEAIFEDPSFFENGKKTEPFLAKILEILLYHLGASQERKFNLAQKIANHDLIKFEHCAWILANTFNLPEEAEALQNFSQATDDKTRAYIEKILAGGYDYMRG